MSRKGYLRSASETRVFARLCLDGLPTEQCPEQVRVPDFELVQAPFASSIMGTNPTNPGLTLIIESRICFLASLDLGSRRLPSSIPHPDVQEFLRSVQFPGREVSELEARRCQSAIHQAYDIYRFHNGQVSRRHPATCLSHGTA